MLCFGKTYWPRLILHIIITNWCYRWYIANNTVKHMSSICQCSMPLVFCFAVI